MNKKIGDQPAFPRPFGTIKDDDGVQCNTQQVGMTLRQYYAGQAIVAILPHLMTELCNLDISEDLGKIIFLRIAMAHKIADDTIEFQEKEQSNENDKPEV